MFEEQNAPLQHHQLKVLRQMLTHVLQHNPFYKQKYNAANSLKLPQTLHEFFEKFPLTTKKELMDDQIANPVYGSNLTYPLDNYSRYHQTSATSGTPMRWLDTPESWQWLLENWKIIYQNAGVTDKDTIYFAFSFGPFLGFWTAFEAATQMGCLCIPGGGLNTLPRLSTILTTNATVLCCTPTYALRLAEIASEKNIDFSRSMVKAIIVAGEPGGSIPAVYERIEEVWQNAKVYDHYGMTEVGPVSYEDPKIRQKMRIISKSYIAEVIDPQTLRKVESGNPGELVLTNLGRWGSPIIRYRTGDMVIQPSLQDYDNHYDFPLMGGVISRIDDMITIRGVNVFPGALEAVMQRFKTIREYRVEVKTVKSMQELRVVVEPIDEQIDKAILCKEVGEALTLTFNLRIPVDVVPVNTLIRFEMKAKRWIRTK